MFGPGVAAHFCPAQRLVQCGPFAVGGSVVAFPPWSVVFGRTLRTPGMSVLRASLMVQSKFNNIITTKAQAAVAHSHQNVCLYNRDFR